MMSVKNALNAKNKRERNDKSVENALSVKKAKNKRELNDKSEKGALIAKEAGEKETATVVIDLATPVGKKSSGVTRSCMST
jgi:hypothetical protein